ncbi:MAG: hypothetical protein C0518_00555 [Opitutus sp.]|nr:hypothetical protein [Opitutus sp.]
MTVAATGPGHPAAPRNAYIDVLRGWSIFGVVCVHFAGSFVTTDIHAWSPSFYLGLALNQFFGFAVPLFVFLSGLLAGLSKNTGSLTEYYQGRFRRIAVPYFIASVAAFFLLNHYAAWQQLPTIAEKLTWLAHRLLFSGVEPTLYFIPLILQLYLLQPLLKALPGWLQQAMPLSPGGWAAVLATLLLILHLTLGWLCDRGTLNYYVWGRPNVLFWTFYFFAGLHFREITGLIPRRAAPWLALLAFLAAFGAMAWNARHLLDRTVMGDHFQFNRLDFAYARPEMLIYDLGMVGGLGLGLIFGWSIRPGLISFLGRFTLEIYLWHILVLYFGVWRYADALQSCRAQPELIVLICLGATVLLAVAADRWQRLRAYVRSHRVVIVKTA